jgi:hypothetical protein
LKISLGLKAGSVCGEAANGGASIASAAFIPSSFVKVEATVARTADCDFEVFRLEGEDEDAFRARAHSECRAADPRPVQILIFSDRL